ncbi:phosphate transport system regulatory protein PhoU, partial [Rhodococcus koreensis]
RAGDEMSELNRCLLERITSPRWPHGVEAAIDVSLLARFYERFSDHAAAIGRRVVFLETGSSGT